MNIMEISLMSLLDLVGYLIISKKLIANTSHLYKSIKPLALILIIIPISFIMGLLDVSIIGKYNFIYGAIFSILFIYLVYRGNLKETIFIYIIATIILLIIQFLVFFILKVVNINNILDFKIGLIAQGFVILILLLISIYVRLDLLFKYTYKNNKIYKYITFNMFIILISILVYRYIEMEGLLKDIFIIGIVIIGLLFINLVLIKNGLKNEYEEKMLLTYERYLPIIDELMEALRKKQHEFDNHIQALSMISLTSRDYESIVSSMQNYIEDLELITDENLLKLENKVLAGFLYGKTKEAEDSNIKFQIVIENYGFKTSLKDYELVEIIGTLINNAFETEIENNIVILSLKKEEDMNVVEIKNKHPYLNSNTLSQIFKSGYSTKTTANHGYGLYNLKKTITNYDGVIDVLNESINEDNYVIFRVLLP